MVTQDEMVAVIGATGKTGSRVARILDAAGRRVRPLSRSSTPPFDWEDAGTWPDALAGCRAAYVAYAPDLVVPGAVDAVRALLDVADAVGLRRVVLLSGRGEEEAQRAEDVVRGWDGEWTIVRAS